MYPLLLKPALKDFIWGGHRLPDEYGYETDLDKVAEAWVLSCHPQGGSVVCNGQYAGSTLAEVLENWGKAALGAHSAEFDRFPILIKFIDACDRLSVQVHPDDEYALRVEGEYGKTEMWYVLDCQPGAKLIYGLNRTLSKEEFRRHISENTLDEVCNYVSVRKGDVFYIPSGTLHAIGAGILLAEVQQNSATTYRVSDYGRLGADGKPRPLHVDKALDVTRLEPTLLTRQSDDQSDVTLLAKCKYFTAEKWLISGEKAVFNDQTFLSLLCLEGEGNLCCGDETIPIGKGDSVFVPAGLSCTIQGEMQLLCSYV